MMKEEGYARKKGDGRGEGNTKTLLPFLSMTSSCADVCAEMLEGHAATCLEFDCRKMSRGPPKVSRPIDMGYRTPSRPNHC